MAPALSDVRNNRVVVQVSEGEKRRIAASAHAADMSVSDFMRTAAEGYSAPTEAERLLMHDLLEQLEAANAGPMSHLRGSNGSATRSLLSTRTPSALKQWNVCGPEPRSIGRHSARR